MNAVDPKQFIEDLYDNAMLNAASPTTDTSLPPLICEWLDIVIKNSESSKGVLAVLFTSCIYKLIHPDQDIRNHQTSIQGGYSGRTFDTKYTTPFLKGKKFPAMAESGWLTRSLEQKMLYNLDYPGAIKPASLKQAFLNTLNEIENKPSSVETIVDYLLQGLIRLRDRQKVKIARPVNLSINGIINLLDKHFHAAYSSHGASRLPVLALYAVYKCLMEELLRFKGKILLPLENHTSADRQSGYIGDIEVVNANNSAFEAVEIKFDIPINHNIVETAKEKIHPTSVERYYILSTLGIESQDMDRIDEDILQIKNTQGCQLVINGVLPTIKYYLRLLSDTKMFILNYADLMEQDSAIKFEHKAMWNQLIGKL